MESHKNLENIFLKALSIGMMLSGTLVFFAHISVGLSLIILGFLIHTES